MSGLIVLLRLIHILSAIVWLGGTFMLAAFVVPTAKRAGPDGARFIQSLAGESRMAPVLAVAAWLTVLAGLALYSFTSGGFDRAWMRSGTGITFGIGAVFGLAALLHGAAVQGVNSGKLAKLGREIAASGGKPSAEQLARMTLLRDKLARGGIVVTVLLAAAAAAMAIARYM